MDAALVDGREEGGDVGAEGVEAGDEGGEAGVGGTQLGSLEDSGRAEVGHKVHCLDGRGQLFDQRGQTVRHKGPVPVVKHYRTDLRVQPHLLHKLLEEIRTVLAVLLSLSSVSLLLGDHEKEKERKGEGP